MVGFRLLAGTFVAGATRVGGGGWADEKARIERMCISLPYVETFNSKVIKGFVPELRSRYVFFEFWDSYVLSLRTFEVRFTHSHIMAMVHLYIFGTRSIYIYMYEHNMSISHIAVYGYGTVWG